MIADFDIGVMPLTDSEWSRGKCGQKLVAYMAMGIPVVANAVGENQYIVDHGRDGFLVHGDAEWVAVACGRQAVFSPRAPRGHA